MQTFRSNLTRLIKLLEQKLPEGNDLYGFKGVSRDSLLTSLKAAYSLSNEIKVDDESRFEVISLKRAGSDLNANLREFFETESEEKKKKKFNQFLDNLSNLIEKTRLTYFIIAKNGIRDDEELASIRLTISELRTLSAELEEQKNDVDSRITEIAEKIVSIDADHKSATEQASNIKVWHDTVNQQYLKINEIHNSIGGWDKEIEKEASQFRKEKTKITELAETAEATQKKLDIYEAQGAKRTEELEECSRKQIKLLKEIEDTLEGANRVGMASSFKARKDELKKSQLIWGVVFGAAVCTIALVVWKIILPTLSGDDLVLEQVALRFGLVSPFVWLGWFAAKQYGYISKIREDYAFKFAAAMAYEGHKKATRETDKELEQVLLEFSLFNMSLNPIRLYGDDKAHGGPIEDATTQVRKNAHHFSFRRLIFKSPKQETKPIESDKVAQDGKK